jgi:hypothetical protein
VNILQHKQHRLFCRESLENGEYQFERPVALSILRSFGRFTSIRRLELRKDRREDSSQRTEEFGSRLAFAFGDSKPQRVHERCVRNRRFSARAPSFNNSNLPARCLMLQISNETAFADTRVPAKEHQSPRSADSIIQPLDEGVELRLATNR